MSLFKRRRRAHRIGIRRCESLERRDLLSVSVDNLPAQNISGDSATVGAAVTEIGATEPVVSIYWGDDDGGTDVRNWDRVANLGTRGVGQYLTTLEQLQTGTTYFYRAFAFSFADASQVWAAQTAQFSTDSLPAAEATLAPVEVVGDSSAQVRGTIDANGSLTSVVLYWGESDGGTNAAAWAQSRELPLTEGAVATMATGLLPATTYFVRLAAANDNGTGWSTVHTFTTSGVSAPLRISEIMPANASTLPTRLRLSAEDRFAGPTNTHDWIEVQNTTSQDIDLSGYFLSDAEQEPRRWQVPSGTTVPAGGAIVFLASGEDIKDPALDEQGLLHTNFALSDGESVLLTAPNGSLVHRLDGTSFMATPDVSLGYFGDRLGTLAIATPAEGNAPIVPVIGSVTHTFRVANNEASPLVVTAAIDPVATAIGSVELIYRIMFGDELTLPMVDDGSGDDAQGGDGLYTATIPGGSAAAGEMIRYFVRVTDTRGTEARMPRFLDDRNSPEYFGTIVQDPTIDTQLPVLHRFVQDTRRAETGSGTRASVYFNGEFYDNVFIRIRGGTARSWPKKAYKIEFNDQYDFRFQPDLPRVDEINLNTTYTDKAYMRAVLSYELYRDSGGIAPITFPMRIEQNGEFWNVAHFVEQPDRDYLRRNGLDPDGAMYKARADRLNGLTGRAQGFFDKKTRHAEDASDLQALIDGLKLSGEELETFLLDNVDLPAQINLMAVNVILQNLDATDKNYYIYRDTEGNQEWKMLPWDLDLVLGPNALNTDNFSTSDDGPPAHTSHPYMGTLRYPFHGRKNHLFDAIINSPRTNAMFLRRLRTLMDQFLSSEETPVESRYFEPRIDELVARLDADVMLDKQRWGNNAVFPGRRYTLEQAAERIKNEYLVPRRVHLFETHSIARLETGEIKIIIPEFASGVSYFVPTDDSLGLSWTDRQDPPNAEQWSPGQLGIGFEASPADYADLLNTQVNPSDACTTCTSLFARVPFSLTDPAAVENMTLRMKFDDAFVAYINGVEVARANTRSETVGFDSRGRSHRDSEAVEFVNFDISNVLSQLDLQADNVLAVHVMNSSTSSNDMLLSLELVDGIVPNANAVGIPRAQIAGPPIVFGSFDQNPVSGNQNEEFIELKNQSEQAIDLSGWQLRGGVTHQFHGGTVIPPGESLYVSPDSLAFRQRATEPNGGKGLFVQDRYVGHLSNRGETIELIDARGVAIASLTTPDIATDLQNFLRITELHYNPAGADESTEFIELRNTSDTITLDLTGVRLTKGPSEPFDFATGNVLRLPPGERLLVVRNVDAFRSAYPDVDPAIIAGQYVGALSNGGETVKLEDAQNATILEFRYEDGRDRGEESWHPSTDGEGFSLVIRNERAAADTWSLGGSWRPSQRIGGSPGTDDIDATAADFNADGVIDDTDIDLLSAGVRQADPRFDLNKDGNLDDADRQLLLLGILNTSVGDSNLDGVFNSTDFLLVFTAGEYEDQVAGNSGWAEGDWDGDGDFTTKDLLTAFQSGSYVAAAISTLAPHAVESSRSSDDPDRPLRERDQQVDHLLAAALSDLLDPWDDRLLR